MTPPTTTPSALRSIAILPVPGFAMMAFTSAIEPMRAANRVAGRELYRWSLHTPAAQPVTASSAIRLLPDGDLDAVAAPATVLVCAGLDAPAYEDGDTLAWLRHHAAAGSRLGALSTGTFVLARAGVLDGYRCTTHWESLPALAESYPRLTVTPSLFEIDRDRLTCSGGTAALDLLLHLIAQDHGEALATAVADQFIHGRIRAPSDRQPMTERIRLRTRAPKLAAALDLMENHIETPLRTARVAASVGLSRRQLERLFHEHMACSPRDHYMRIRLERARVLLLETGLSILNVAVATGFSSQSHFGACYRRHFGHTPRQARTASAVEPTRA